MSRTMVRSVTPSSSAPVGEPGPARVQPFGEVRWRLVLPAESDESSRMRPPPVQGLIHNTRVTMT